MENPHGVNRVSTGDHLCAFFKYFKIMMMYISADDP